MPNSRLPVHAGVLRDEICGLRDRRWSFFRQSEHHPSAHHCQYAAAQTAARASPSVRRGDSLRLCTAIVGEQLTQPQRVLIGWFGIRGIGSVFYLLSALRHGLDARLADTLVSLTLWAVAPSIVRPTVTSATTQQPRRRLCVNDSRSVAHRRSLRTHPH